MPIRINLLTEALAEEDLRRRDPVKRAIFLGVFLVVLSLVWYSSVWLETKVLQNDRTKVEDKIQSLTSDFSRVESDRNRRDEGQRRLDALQNLSTNRFLQGNLMNVLQQVYVPNVQLTRMKLGQIYSYKDGTPSQTNSYGVVPGRPSIATERIILTLDAKDASPNPGDQVNHYKDALATFPYFRAALDPTNGVRLLTASAPQTSMNEKPFVGFTLECRFPDKTR